MPTAPRSIHPRPPRAIDRRPHSGHRGYDSTWQKLRILVLADEPLCRRCRDAGRITAATLVDHVVPLAEGGPRLDRSNLQPLCNSCHAVKTAEDQRRVNDEPSTGRMFTMEDLERNRRGEGQRSDGG